VSIVEKLRLVQAEYLEFPGLHLTRAQARRLWNLDEETWDAVVDALVAAGFLRQTARAGYVLGEAVPRAAIPWSRERAATALHQDMELYEVASA
jgi:hypothetical protein